MKERLFFECEGDMKKEILAALKNEQKYNKQIPVYDANGEELCKTIKWDTYHSYIDFWLNNVIADFATTQPGKIQSITLYDYETQKGQKMKRVKQILA